MVNQVKAAEEIGETFSRVDGSGIGEPIDTATFAGRLHWIIKRFKALDCELLSEGPLHRATFRIDELDQDMVDELRELLKEDFVSLKVVPEGMAFMLAEVSFRS